MINNLISQTFHYSHDTYHHLLGKQVHTESDPSLVAGGTHRLVTDGNRVTCQQASQLVEFVLEVAPRLRRDCVHRRVDSLLEVKPRLLHL